MTFIKPHLIVTTCCRCVRDLCKYLLSVWLSSVLSSSSSLHSARKPLSRRGRLTRSRICALKPRPAAQHRCLSPGRAEGCCRCSPPRSLTVPCPWRRPIQLPPPPARVCLENQQLTRYLRKRSAGPDRTGPCKPHGGHPQGGASHRSWGAPKHVQCSPGPSSAVPSAGPEQVQHLSVPLRQKHPPHPGAAMARTCEGMSAPV